MRNLTSVFLLALSLGSGSLYAQSRVQALPPSIPPEEYISLAERPEGVTLSRENPGVIIRYIDRITAKSSSFVTTNRNPFISNFGGSDGGGSVTAEQIWNEVQKALPIVGVNVNEEDPRKSSLVLGDILLSVGNPLPKHVFNAPIEVVLVDLTSEEASFEIIMADPNQLSSERQIVPFKWRIVNDLIPTVQPTSRYQVNMPSREAEAEE